MRRVADHAGFSTGMINHYFANRGEMLRETLVYVSEEMQARAAEAIRGEPAGEVRMRAFLRAVLPLDPDVEEAWRIWIASFAEAVRSEPLRATIDQRLSNWYPIIERAMEGYHPPDYGVPAAWEFDAMLNGLVIQYLTGGSGLTLEHLEQAMLAFLDGVGARAADGRLTAS